MPTLLIVDGFRFHSLQQRAERAASRPRQQGIGCGEALASARVFTPAEQRRIRELTFGHQVVFVERWNEYFGR